MTYHIFPMAHMSSNMWYKSTNEMHNFMANWRLKLAERLPTKEWILELRVEQYQEQYTLWNDLRTVPENRYFFTCSILFEVTCPSGKMYVGFTHNTPWFYFCSFCVLHSECFLWHHYPTLIDKEKWVFGCENFCSTINHFECRW